MKRHSDIVKQSHQRSIQYGIDKEQVVSKKILSHEAVSENLQKNSGLIRITMPLLRDLHDFLTGSGFIMVLTDQEGCILDVIGDQETLRAALELNMVVGASMNEQCIGTNAMGTAIRENAPVQISATEHFITAYHRWTCSAAPIHSPGGEIIGTLNLTGASRLVHPHTLGIVVAAVRSVEFQLRNEVVQNQLILADRYSTTLMNSIAHGILGVSSGVVTSANNAASRLLDLEKDRLGAARAATYIEDWQAIDDRLRTGETLEDEEVTLVVNGKKEKILLSAQAILGERADSMNLVLTLKEIQKVLNLVNRFTGMQARYTFADFIGESPEMERIVGYAKHAADSPATILIDGESGTGKEVLAQAIHNHSARRSNGFVAINCGAIHRNLMESELFGYDEGAFTGAKRGGQLGKFELANGGTLFLDEIGEMPLDLQVNLLRVLQEGYVMRVGSNKCIPVNVRIIAATNKDLNREIALGNFRQDLYYRLSVIPITIPPLRERREDILLLAEHFIRAKSAKLGKAPIRLPEEVADWVCHNPWRGNIRELENFIEKVIVLDGRPLKDMLSLCDVPENKVSGGDEVNRGPSVNEQDYACSLEILERRAIAAALKKTDHNVTLAAKVLGISRNTFYLKIKKYGIQEVY